MQDAPFHKDVAGGPENVRAAWVEATDGVRLRAAIWPADAAQGTVLLFPGRTEYAEKYAEVAGDLCAAGLTTLAIDWRGQGLADRLLPDRMPGHVGHFDEYQRDVAAIVAFATAERLPKPWYLLAHSMGGVIGLRALIEGLPVERAAFSAPMWGISLGASLRPAAWTLSFAARAAGLTDRYAPGTSRGAYQSDTPFESNLLTHDEAQYARLAAQTTAYPDLALGGPSLGWLGAALSECRRLARRPSPATPCVTLLGTDELIVDTAGIRSRMARWPNGRLITIDGGRHECLMETPPRRALALSAVLEHFDALPRAGLRA